MKFADFDAVLLEAADNIARFFELHCQMAGVVVDTEMGVKPGIFRAVSAQLLKEFRRLLAGFQIAERLRLQSEMQFRS